MPNDISPVREYFAKLGLEPEIADVYLALQAYGPQSLLQLSRNAKIERTRLYRLLDTLAECHLVEIEEEHKRKTYKAAPIGNLQVLLTKREQEIRDLHKELLELQENYQAHSLRSPLTHVQFYRGIDGVKQMFWNQTRAKGESLSILYANMQSKSNLAFFERWVERCNTLELTFRSIVGDHFLQTQKEWYGRTRQRKTGKLGRPIPTRIYPAHHAFNGDVRRRVVYYNWKDGEVFGMEIYNQEIAAAQRHNFETFWKQARPIPGHGEQ